PVTTSRSGTGRAAAGSVAVFAPPIMRPTAIAIDCPVLPQTCAANSAAISRPRCDTTPDAVVSVLTGSTVVWGGSVDPEHQLRIELRDARLTAELHHRLPFTTKNIHG